MTTDVRTIIREHEADLVVAESVAVADGVVALTLTDPTGAALPSWTPGAHVDLVLGADLVRQYSLCGPVADRHSWRVAVLPYVEGNVALYSLFRPSCTGILPAILLSGVTASRPST